MKNSNMVRTYGRKDLYFSNEEMAKRFVDLYKDLFVKSCYWTTKTEDGCMIVKKETTKGPLYKLMFIMNHEDMRKVDKDLKIKKKKFEFVYGGFLGNETKTVRFVG